MWLKRKWNPFDVTNVSITAFAHKISMEIIEKGVILWRECLGVTYWILLLPEYQYTVRIPERLQNYMIFHLAERLKLQHSGLEKVGYLSSSLRFAAKVRGENFLCFNDGLSADTIGVQRRSRVGQLRLEKVRQGKIMLDEHMCEHDGTQTGVAGHVSVCLISVFVIWILRFQAGNNIFTSRLHLLSAGFSPISDFSFLCATHTLACLNLWKTVFGGSEDVR